jgi:hypothetical protein
MKETVEEYLKEQTKEKVIDFCMLQRDQIADLERSLTALQQSKEIWIKDMLEQINYTSSLICDSIQMAGVVRIIVDDNSDEVEIHVPEADYRKEQKFIANKIIVAYAPNRTSVPLMAERFGWDLKE